MTNDAQLRAVAKMCIRDSPATCWTRPSCAGTVRSCWSCRDVYKRQTLYCHEGDWSWIYFFNGQCADAAGTALWQWLGQQRR